MFFFLLWWSTSGFRRRPKCCCVRVRPGSAIYSSVNSPILSLRSFPQSESLKSSNVSQTEVLGYLSIRFTDSKWQQLQLREDIPVLYGYSAFLPPPDPTRNEGRWRVSALLDRLYRPLLQTEQMLLKMTHLYTMINQIVFFTLCDRAIGSNEKINSVYSLMLYNVIAYCLQYVKDMIEKEDWSPYVNVSQHSNVRHLAMTATKIVLEWTKAVTFLITIVFLVLSFSAKEGLEKYQPTAAYTFITLLHYGATEKTFSEMFPKFLSRLQLQSLESLEALWAPVILKAYTIVISAVFVLFQIALKNYRLAICGVYINVILCWKDAYKTCFQDLKRELEILNMFEDASSKQLASFDDICSICLCPMKAAKVTPCHHLFHGECLRRCLKSGSDCPICKRELIPSYN